MNFTENWRMVRVILALTLSFSAINAAMCVDGRFGLHRLSSLTLDRPRFPFLSSQQSSSERILLASDTSSSALRQEYIRRVTTGNTASRSQIASVINVERGLFRCLQTVVRVNFERNQFLTPIRSTVIESRIAFPLPKLHPFIAKFIVLIIYHGKSLRHLDPSYPAGS